MTGEWSDIPQRVPKDICANCYEPFPQDQLQKVRGVGVCPSCRESLGKRTGQPLVDEDPELGEESRAPRLSDIPHPAQRAPADKEEELRSRLLQLEHEKKMRPKDTQLLRELADLYELLGDRDEAAYYRDEFLRLHPVESGAPGKTLGEKPKRTARLRVEPEPTSVPFWTDLEGFLRYPARTEILPVTAGGGAALGLALSLGQITLLGYFLFGLIATYLGTYWINVTAAAASGSRERPELPGFLNLWHSLLRPFLGAVASAAIPFAPFLLALLAAAGLLGFGGVMGPLLVALGLVGLFAAPMALLGYVVYDSVGRAVDPRFLVGSIHRIFADYVLLYAALCALISATGVAEILVALAVRFLVPFLELRVVLLFVGTSAIAVYGALIAARLLGHACAQTISRLEWFGMATEPEKPLGVPVLLAGAGGAALVSLVSLAVLFVFPPLVAGALGFGDLPLQDSTFLQFQIHDSNSSPSSRRYEIHEVDGGFRILATTIMEMGSATFSDFIVDREGRFVTGPPPQEGPLYVGPGGGGKGERTTIVGPPWIGVGKEHMNGYPVVGKALWKGWKAFAVRNTDTSGTLYYHRATGCLVGVDLSEAGRDHWAVLVETNVPGLEVPEAGGRSP